jgi:hypothetical protein
MVGGEPCGNGEISVVEIPKITMKTNLGGYYFRVLKPVRTSFFFFLQNFIIPFREITMLS